MHCENLAGEVMSYLGAGAGARAAAGSGIAWAGEVRRAHREGRALMCVCKVWRSAAAGTPAFFGRLLVAVHGARERLPFVAGLHGRATTWATLDGARPAREEDAKSPGEADDARRHAALSYDMAGGARQPVLDAYGAACVWTALGGLPKLERLELTRTTFGARGPSPARCLPERLPRLRSLCLYRCAGLTADALAEVLAACPRLDTLELHHACPWRKIRDGLADAEAAAAGRDAPVARVLAAADYGIAAPVPAVEDDDEDDSLAAWIAGASMAAPGLRTLRVGDGLDSSALEWVATLDGLTCLNVMHTYAVDDLPRALGRALHGPRLLALSVHVDGVHQNADAVAAAVATSLCAATLRVLAISDHVAPPSRARTHAPVDTLTDVGLCAIARSCVALARLLVDDAGAITVKGAVALLEHAPALTQLGLRRCFAARFSGAKVLYDVAAHSGVSLHWEPRADATKPSHV